MGGGSWTSSNWDSYSSTIKGKTVDAIYSKKVKDDFLPKNIIKRESRVSEEHPNPTSIIIGLDVTGSMNDVLDTVVKKLNVIVEKAYSENIITDPQIMFSAIGDHVVDDYPLQVTQFESDIRIAEQLKELFFEKGGGGNNFESYPLIWHFANKYTEIDSLKKNKKGFIFTIGDDGCPDKLNKEFINRYFKDSVGEDISVKHMLNEVAEKYEVFHIYLTEDEDKARYRDSFDMLGERLIILNRSSVDKIPEIIISTLQLLGGKNLQEVTEQWGGDTSLVVHKSLKDLSVIQSEEGIVTFK